MTNNMITNSSSSSSSSSNNYNMDDILIVTAKHSERAILRANLLKIHFDKITKQRGRKPFNFLHIKIEDGPFSEEIACKYQNTALQIVLICPMLLALSHSLLMTQLSAIVRVEKVLAILLDVNEEKIKAIHKTALPNYMRWRRCIIRDNDQAEIGNILGIATDILGRALCQRPVCQDAGNVITRSVSNCSDSFTIMPKKVKIGQNKIVVMLSEPLEKDDILKITVEKSGELIEIHNFKCRNPYTLQLAIPECCMEISTMIELRIEKNDKNLGARPIKCESRLRELEQLLRIEDSPIEFMCHALGVGLSERDDLDVHLLQCFQKNMPPNFHLLSGTYEKSPQHSHHIFTTRESSAEEYPTLLHFAARWGLQRLCMQLLECPGGDTACGIRNSTGKTAAELADLEGHHKLARNILSFSEFHELTTMYHYFKGINMNDNINNNMQSTCNNKNLNSKIIIEPVKSNKHSSCDESTIKPKGNVTTTGLLRNVDTTTEYMEMSSGSDRDNTPEFNEKKPLKIRAVSNLNYVSVDIEDDNLQDSTADVQKNIELNKVLTGPEITTKELVIMEPPYYTSNEQNQTIGNTCVSYQTDKFSYECSQLLENYQEIVNNNEYVKQPKVHAVISISDDGNYLFQPSNIPVNEQIKSNIYHTNNSSCRLVASQPTYGSLKRSISNASSTTRSNVDDELAEIMHDFKNNVLSIREVEILVEKWKHRNDVQQSFREKQDHIDQLRKEYERIQDQVRSQLKRDTPFDKFKKLFSRHKSTTNLNHDKISCADSILDETKSSITTSSSFKSNTRPISSLSLQSVSSSNSSGRLSTGSNCSGTSMGDSGTHSDHDERRFVCRLGTPSSLMENYLVPPPPRPVFTPNSTPVDEQHQIIFPSPLSPYNRLNSPNSPLSAEHYQLFPSNIPVYPVGGGMTNNQNCNNNNYLNTIMEVKHETIEPNVNYQNLDTEHQDNITLQPIKLNERQPSNIIYGKLNKISPNCSSFKPNQSATLQVQVEVYQNLGDNLEYKIENNETNDNQEVLTRNSDLINNKQEIGIIVSNNENCNYMNC